MIRSCLDAVGFLEEILKSLLCTDPVQVRAAWMYLIEVAQVQPDKIAACPRVLRLPQYTLRTRHKFARAKSALAFGERGLH